MKITKQKIFYWSPFLVPIATPKAVINSAYALERYSDNYECSIINFFGEFNFFKKEIEKKKINLKKNFFSKIYKLLPYKGKIRSRFSFLIIFILSFFPLKKIILDEKPDYLIVQLITSLPMFLLLLFKFNTRFILRISGLPKLGFFRKLLWKIALKKFYLITCPTKATLEYMRSLNIVSENKIRLLYDPIIEIRNINYKKNLAKATQHSNYFLAAGRLTKQKNFLFLCKVFKIIINKHPSFKLLIAGDGEDKKKIEDYIEKNKLKKNIFLIGHIENIFPLMKGAEAFILSSLWEDPGFVIVEAAFCRTAVFSSDCLEGPKEIIKDNINGILFKSNDLNDFVKNFDRFNSIINNKDLKKKLILNNLILTKKFSLFIHYLKLDKILKGFN
ncbi:glycosyltransferase [Candidatus Pelagibacter sp.]|nr:glycosyltransferase [Candidatus Pelagibacter sp.]